MPSYGYNVKKAVSEIMKTSILSFIAVICLSTALHAQEPIRVACVGNSITYGHRLKNRSTESYPSVLGEMLGEKYEVRNFGISARTLLNKGDHPYMKEQLFTEARAFHPDIVVIKLGTNDTKPHNWKYAQDFRHDLSALIDSFRCEGSPRIYLCYPATVYGLRWGINDSTLVHGVIPAIKKTARKKKVRHIDLHTATQEMPENFPDGVHPNAAGARILAEEVFKAITNKR